MIVPLVMSTFGAMQDGLHFSIAKTSTFAVKTHCYIPGMDEYFIFKWKQIIAITLIRPQAVAFRSIVAADSVSGAADIWGGSWRFGVSAPKCFASERERA